MIIGNNKFKSIFLREDLINSLIELVNNNYIDSIRSNDLNFDDSLIDLINQIILTLASFCLGNLQHVTRLINNFNIPNLIYYILRINCDKISINSNKNSIKLIESCLRCLSNLYISAQMSPYLIFKLDHRLYDIDQSTQKSINIDTLLRLFSMSNFSKETILNIFSVSSQTLTTLILLTEESSIRENSIKINIQQIISNRRNLLIKSDLIKIFSSLLVNTQSAIQLNVLKFYASISFESHESTRYILNTTFANTDLIDLIGAYLSRENCSELQLYSAKCLTNICRSCSLESENKKSNVKNNSITPTNNNMLNYSDYSSTENSMDFNQVNFENLDKQFNTKNQQVQEENLTQKYENNLKTIRFNSQLIKQKTLPTLIRLCCTYSINYRTNNYNNLNTLQSNQSLNKSLNTLLLIESISTLTYLIELNVDLQQIGSYLEQIIPTLSFNILNAYSSGADLDLIDSNLECSDEDINFHSKPNRFKKRKEKLQKTSSIEIDRESKTDEAIISDSIKSQLSLLDGSSKSESSLYSYFYLSYSQFVTKGIHFIMNEHQYRFKNHILINNDKNNEKTQHEKLESMIMNELSAFTKDLDNNIHKRVVCVCFQALAALASNNEEARRNISENMDLMSKLIESIRVKTKNDNQNNFNQKLKFDEKLNKVEPSFIDEEELEEDYGDANGEEEDDDFEIDQSVDKNFDQDDNNDVIMNNNEEDLVNNDLHEFIVFVDKDLNDFSFFLNTKNNSNSFNALNNLLIRSDSNLMRTSALCLLHSLSRSVQQLRTKFLDNQLWMSILDLIKRIKIRKLKRAEIFKLDRSDSTQNLEKYCLKIKTDDGESNMNKCRNSDKKRVYKFRYDYGK